ncbi:MAG: hypothetical protein IPK27_07730 [Rhodanobacteraceae bacterium]|nr:hypothetical protein [Rhodanobacteraceae bacterium]
MLVAALMMQGWALGASACSPIVLVFPPGAPVPAEVVRGLVTAESRTGSWWRTVRIQPQKQLRGAWTRDLEAAVSCGSESPRVGEMAWVFRERAGEGEWRLVPNWQADEFLEFLGDAGADGAASAGGPGEDSEPRR